MYFRTRPARASVAHHPEIIFLIAVNDVDIGFKSGGLKFLRPNVPRFLIQFARVAFARIRLIDGCVKAMSREFPNLGHKFPRPLDGFAFEVIAEGPVSEHFEERVVICVESDVFKIVVFASGANALLRVDGPCVQAGDRARPFAHVGFFLPEEDGHELVHACIREEKVRRIGHETGRWHNGVSLRFEEIQKIFSNLITRSNFG